VGKTHLLQGICNGAAKGPKGRQMNYRYVTAEQFTNEFLSALRQKKIAEFRGRYRNLDLLAIDDVHFLAAKKATQDEFLHTYNAIESLGKQIVLASDVPPRMVGELNEQLTSRFLSGMVVRIDAPDEDTRIKVLRQRARKMKLDIEADVLEYIAVHVRSSVRELEGTLVKLAALSALGNGRVTLEMATDALADHLSRTDSAVTLGGIESVVAPYFGITPADLHSSRRTRTISLARMVAMVLARQHTQMSFPEIGRFMGKNHSSVILACKRMEKLLAEGGEVKWNTPGGTRCMPAATLLDLLNEQIR
jgi:chromosomal replication initiator protein